MTRDIVVLDLGLDTNDDAAWSSLLRAASLMNDVSSLTIASLRREPPAVPLGCPSTWWRFDAPGEADVDDAVAQGLRMLSHEGMPAGPVLVLLPAGAANEEAAARLAARSGGTALGRCAGVAIDVDGAVIATRLVHGGRLAIDLRASAERVFACWRAPASPAGTEAMPAQHRHVDLLAASIPRLHRTPLPTTDAQRSFIGARLIVAGGRGIGSAEGFEQLARIAAPLRGAVGASLPAVDAGWLPVSRQIGQSGHFVAPRVYLAVALSGTLQHLAGVSADSAVFAINDDPDAAIFDVAEIGVVADWHAFVPLLVNALARALQRPLACDAG